MKLLRRPYLSGSYLCFPHIAKTGGTSLNYHFRQYLGKDHIYALGPFARMERFLHRKKQLEELPAPEGRLIKVIQGHGVKFDTMVTLRYLVPDPIVVLRDPVSHFYSRYNHWYNFQLENGGDTSLEAFLGREHAQGNNFITTLLTKQFQPVVDVVGGSIEELMRIFKFVFSTQRLNEQAIGLFKTLRIPTTLERRRVAESKVMPDISPNEILDRNPLDAELYEKVQHHHSYSSLSDSFSPFGFKPKILNEMLREMWRSDNEETYSARLTSAYLELVHSLAAERRLEVALEMMNTKDCHWISRPELLRKMIEDAWNNFLKSSPNAEALAVSAFRLARYYQNDRMDTDNATELYERSLDLWPDSAVTMAYFGDLLLHSGQQERGRQLVTQALAIAPNRQFIRDIAKQLA